MHETLCFSIQSLSPNLDDLPLRSDGCETVSCVVGYVRIILGSSSDRSRIGSALQMGLQLFFVCVRSTEFHGDLQLQDCSRNVNGIASGAAG